MTAPAPLAACYVRARRAVPVLVNGPGDDDNPPIRSRGRLRDDLWFKLGLPMVPAMQRDTRQGELLEVAA